MSFKLTTERIERIEEWKQEAEQELAYYDNALNSLSNGSLIIIESYESIIADKLNFIAWCDENLNRQLD